MNIKGDTHFREEVGICGSKMMISLQLQHFRLIYIIFMVISGFEKMYMCIPFEGGVKNVCFVHL